MATQTALIIDAGTQKRIVSTDTLAVGAGINPSAAGALSIGTGVATSIVIGSGGITTSFPGPVALTGGISTVGGTTFQTNATFQGDVTFGVVGVDGPDIVTFVATVASDIVMDGTSSTTGTATSGGASTLTDTGAAWTVNAFAGNVVQITAGTGVGQSNVIASNTATVLTTTTPWATAPDATSVYDIRTESTRIRNLADPSLPQDGATKAYVDASVVLPGGADTAVQYNNGGAFGGSNSFTWDATNNRLGVGTNTPTTAVDVKTGQVAIPDGTAAAPALAFRDDLNTGFYSPSNDIVGIAVNGAEVARFQQSGAGNTPVMLLGTSSVIGAIAVDSSDASGTAGVVMLGHAAAGTVIQESYRGGQFTGVRSRGTKAVPTAVGAGDGLVDMLGAGWTATGGINYGGLVTFKAEEAYTATASGGRIEFHTTTSGTDGFTTLGSATTERMRITNAGDVGIGTATPNEKLTVSGVISIGEGSAPSATTAFGKLWADSALDARPFWVDDVGNGFNLTLDRFNALASGGAITLNLDPSLPIYNSVTLNGNATFSTLNRGNGRSAYVRVICDGTTRTLTFPGTWTWMGTAPPADLAANDVAWLSIVAFGATDADVVAAWIVENTPAVVNGSGTVNQIAFWTSSSAIGGDPQLTYNSGTDVVSLAGGLTQTVGAVSLTAGAASSFTTTAGALTITGAAASTWSTAAGDLNLTATTNSVVITGAEAAVDAVTITSSNAAGGVDVNAGTGGVTIDTTGSFSIDGAAASNVTVTGSGLSLTLEAAGGGAQKVLVQSAGTGVDAIDLVATAGGFSIDGAAASNVSVTGADLTLSTITSGDVVIATQGAASALVVKTTTGRVGVGNSAPTQLLSVGAASEFAVATTGTIKTYAGAAPLDGQVLVGDTAAGDFEATTITAGSGITVTNGAGSITIATTGGAADTLDIAGTAFEALAINDLVRYVNDAGTPRVQKADSNDTARQNPVGFVLAAAAANGDPVTIRIAGVCPVAAGRFDSAPAVADVGSRVFMSTTAGQLTLTAPSTTGDVVQRIGILVDGSGSPKVLLQIGEPITL